MTLLGQNVNSYCDKSEVNVLLHTTKSLSRGFRENYKTNTAKGIRLINKNSLILYINLF